MDITRSELEKRKSIEIFCCYAREDQKFLLELKKHLMAFRREGLITLWADVDIDAGTEWEKEIHSHLNTARIILLFISADFLASEYCYSVEMQRAMERHEQGEACVIPIIIRPVSWQKAPFGKLQVLPTGANPIVSNKWYSQDEAFNNVVEGIQKVIEAYQRKDDERRKSEESITQNIQHEENYDKTKDKDMRNIFEKMDHIQFMANRTRDIDLELSRLFKAIGITHRAWSSQFPFSKESRIIDPQKRKIILRIAYYGHVFGGKTENLDYIRQTANPQDLVDITTDTSKMSHFDLLTLELGEIQSFQVRAHLYTVPRQFFDGHTRLLFLKGADCVIFVVDSRPSELQEHIECLNEIQEQLRLVNKDIANFPLIIQWNKRNLQDVLPVSVLERYVNPYRVPSFEAVAETGKGVMESLNAAINVALKSLML